MSGATVEEVPFARRFERELYRRTGGRISGLEIEEQGRQIVVSCSVPSLHVRLLVVLAVLTALPPGGGRDVVLHVHVSPAPPLAEGSGADGAWAGPPRRARPPGEDLAL
jgi:hypothetical protein